MAKYLRKKGFPDDYFCSDCNTKLYWNDEDCPKCKEHLQGIEFEPGYEKTDSEKSKEKDLVEGRKPRLANQKIPFWVWIFFLYLGASCIFDLAIGPNIVALGFVLVMVYVGYSLFTFKPNAVLVTKILLILNALFNILIFVALAINGIISTPLATNTVLTIMWFRYFSNSEQIETAYPDD
jgi:hypothetical protein